MNEEIFKIKRDVIRANSLLEMAKERFNDIKKESKAYKIIEEYYEIIKELITSLMYLEGLKTLSHKMLIVYLEKNYNNFDKSEIFLIDELRKIRNNILYYGQKINENYLINNKEKIKEIINKLFILNKEKVKLSQ